MVNLFHLFQVMVVVGDTQDTPLRQFDSTVILIYSLVDLGCSVAVESTLEKSK